MHHTQRVANPCVIFARAIKTFRKCFRRVLASFCCGVTFRSPSLVRYENELQVEAADNLK
jgi:hypothetical protein